MRVTLTSMALLVKRRIVPKPALAMVHVMVRQESADVSQHFKVRTALFQIVL